MKFSLFFEMQMSRPNKAKEIEIFRSSVDQAVLADKLGYSTVWAVEHHGLYEYSHCSAPEVFLSYVAALTKNIRLGHGITLTPYRYNHPIRIAERIATLDILSGGRVNWGSGKGATLVEKGAFGCDIESLHSQWLESLHMIPKMWRDDIFEWEGEHVTVPPTQVIPKPVQTPNPPIFGACSRKEAVMEMAELGIGALDFASGTFDTLSEKIAAYKETFKNSNNTRWKTNNHYACVPTSLVLKDDKKACELGFQAARYFAGSLSYYTLAKDRPVGEMVGVNRDAMEAEELEWMMSQRNQPDTPMIHVIGDPVAARESVSRFVDAGVDELILLMQIGTTPNDLVYESIKTFGEEVIPYFS
ncbi:LLM class flavin-dependent oxidoreductase [Bacterioplanoides sp.]|uniref:LLM class flavin-dependent oxidoreductase n=1 Tax=Bacterioplanoides sp. TaxID=2066072 RepID=UPI003B5BA06D